MILFVCTGNTCRSPLAAALARQRGIDAQSAGLSPWPGAPATLEAQRAAMRRGADLSAHRARAVSEEMLSQAEKIFAMTERHAQALRAFSPQNASKVFVLSPQIPDPFGGGEQDYERCALLLLEAIRQAHIL